MTLPPEAVVLLDSVEKMIDYLLDHEPERMQRRGMVDIYEAAHALRAWMDGRVEPLSDPSVDSAGLVSSDGSATQKAGAFAAFPKSGTQRMQVLNAIAVAGFEGVTDDELCEATGLNYSRVGPRRRELIEGGWVCDSGKTRPSEAGTETTVWVLTAQAAEFYIENVAVDV